MKRRFPRLGLLLFLGLLTATALVKAAATVEIIEYSDFQCPYCHKVIPTLDQVFAKYGDKVKLTYKHFPLDFHAAAMPAAAISECARDQGKFKEVHDAFFTMNPQAMTEASLMAAAKAKVPDPTALESCYKSGKKQDLATRQIQEAQSLGINGTPGFVIAGKVISGAQPFEVFDRVISVALDPTQGTPLYVITPPGCKSCVPEDLLTEITGQALQGAVRTDIPFDSKRGQELHAQMNFTALPVVALGKALEQEPGFRQLARYVTRKGDLYLLTPALVPPTLYLKPLPAYSFDLGIGPAKAPVTIVEYTDFISDRAALTSRAVVEVLRKYPGKVRHVVRPAAASGQTLDQSRLVGQAAYCLSDQGKFWKGYPLLSLLGAKATVADLGRVALDTGANAQTFTQCLARRERFAQRVKAYDEDLQTLSLPGGVSLFVGRERLPSPGLYDVMKSVEAVLKAKAAPKAKKSGG